MFNNPFSTSLGYCDSEDDFEIWFTKKEENPRERQSVESIEKQLKGYNLIQLSVYSLYNIIFFIIY